jgi:hypothetical protein
LERKFGKYAIPNLMRYVVVLYAVGFVIYVFGGDFYSRYLSLDMAMVFRGQIWRLVTFIMQPPSTSLIFIFFSLYFYYLMGNILERAWGTFRFNLYYIMGVLLHIVAALVIYLVFHVSYAFSTYYLNMSLFLAFATIMPDSQVLVMFIIPVKVKWIAYLDMLYLGLTVLSGFLVNVLPYNIIYGLATIGIYASPVTATAALISVLNFVVFYSTTRNFRRYTPKETVRRATYRHKVHVGSTGTKHKCAVCGRTEKDDDTLEFRYCSKCQGNFEYCQEHLYTHKHVIKND